MFAIVPYQVDVGMSRWPFANFLLIGLLVFTSITAFGAYDPSELQPFILRGWSASQMFGHMFLHAGILHLAGNMIFLWTFGNAVCAKVGNLLYFPLFLALGLSAATAHNLIDAAPAIGASGAINGIVGMYLVYFPRNNVSCLYWLLFRFGTFHISSFWVILLFFAFDASGAYRGAGGVAYWAHLGGFATGITVATLSLLTGFVKMRSTEESLLDVLGVTD